MRHGGLHSSCYMRRRGLIDRRSEAKWWNPRRGDDLRIPYVQYAETILHTVLYPVSPDCGKSRCFTVDGRRHGVQKVKHDEVVFSCTSDERDDRCMSRC
jgi:hypothetical protein